MRSKRVKAFLLALLMIVTLVLAGCDNTPSAGSSTPSGDGSASAGSSGGKEPAAGGNDDPDEGNDDPVAGNDDPDKGNNDPVAGGDDPVIGDEESKSEEYFLEVFDSVFDAIETESNNDLSSAEYAGYDFTVAAHLDAGQTDIFCFEAAEGDEIFTKVLAENLDNVFAMTCVILDEAGDTLYTDDDDVISRRSDADETEFWIDIYFTAEYSGTYYIVLSVDDSEYAPIGGIPYLVAMELLGSGSGNDDPDVGGSGAGDDEVKDWDYFEEVFGDTFDDIEVEDNNSISMADGARYGTTVAAHIDNGQVDYFCFDALAGDELLVKISVAEPDSAFTLKCSILDEDGNSIVSDDEMGRYSSLDETEFWLDTLVLSEYDGLYYILVSVNEDMPVPEGGIAYLVSTEFLQSIPGYGDDEPINSPLPEGPIFGSADEEEMSYEDFQSYFGNDFNSTERESNNSFEDADYLSVDSPQAAYVNGGDIDLFRFEVEELKETTVIVYPASSYDADYLSCAVLDEYGNYLPSYTNDMDSYFRYFSGDDGSSYLYFTFNPEYYGTYYLYVTTWEDCPSDMGIPYRTWLELAPNPAEVEVAKSWDYFEELFGDRFILIEEETEDPYYSNYLADREYYAAHVYGGESDRFGTYMYTGTSFTAKVIPYSQADIDSLVCTLRDGGDDIVGVLTPVRGDDGKYYLALDYTVTYETGYFVHVTTTEDYDGAEGVPYLVDYEYDIEEAKNWDYFVSVFGGGFDTIEEESNNTYNDGSFLREGMPMAAHIGACETDWFRTFLSEGEKMVFTVTPKNGNDIYDLQFTAYGPWLSDISVTEDITDGVYTVTFTATADDYHFLHVQAEDYVSGIDYIVEMKPWVAPAVTVRENEPNDDYGNADELEPGMVIEGTLIESTMDTDTFVFYASEGQTVTLTQWVDYPDIVYISSAVLDEDYELLPKDCCGGIYSYLSESGDSVQSLTFTAPWSGYFYLSSTISVKTSYTGDADYTVTVDIR